MMIQSGEGKGQGADQMFDEEEVRASQHTFFISNSQRKLKLVTKNAVCLFLF
jgi:phospholipase D1/2